MSIDASGQANVMKYPGSLSYIPTEKDNKDTEDKVMKKRCFYN